MVFKRLHGLNVAPEEFIPFGGQGEEVFLGGIANKYQVLCLWVVFSCGLMKWLFEGFRNCQTLSHATAAFAQPRLLRAGP